MAEQQLLTSMSARRWMSTVQVLSSPTAPAQSCCKRGAVCKATPLDRRSHAASCRHSAVQEGLRARGAQIGTPELLVSEGPTQLALIRAEPDILFKHVQGFFYQAGRWGDRSCSQLQYAQFSLVIQARTATP